MMATIIIFKRVAAHSISIKYRAASLNQCRDKPEQAGHDRYKSGHLNAGDPQELFLYS